MPGNDAKQSLRFAREARVRAAADYDRIFKLGRRVALPVMALHWQAIDAGPRLGLAVSRKVDPHAVGRNRIKRVLRDAFRHCRAELPKGDYVLVVRVGAAALDGEQLRATLRALLARAGALPPTAAAVTMPAACAPSPSSLSPDAAAPPARAG